MGIKAFQRILNTNEEALDCKALCFRFLAAQEMERPEPPVGSARAITRQRPTLAGPNVQLPLAAEGLTAVFEMGTGGTPRL